MLTFVISDGDSGILNVLGVVSSNSDYNKIQNELLIWLQVVLIISNRHHELLVGLSRVEG